SPATGPCTRGPRSWGPTDPTRPGTNQCFGKDWPKNRITTAAKAQMWKNKGEAVVVKKKKNNDFLFS
ncbi:unnamed protein product, partial [Heterosigma akashiwo]